MKRIISILSILVTLAVTAQEKTGLTVRHLSNEQNIIEIEPGKRFLLLPVQDNAPEGQLYFVRGCERSGNVMNIRLAREKTDYYIPLSLDGFGGEKIKIDVQGVPKGSICWTKMSLSDEFSPKTSERPVYHHTPEYGWMNDPNGMFYKDGVWHLYYQSNPFGCTWGNMHWSHSSSYDLIHWKYEGIAIAPDAWGTVFSGSAVVDYDNTAGFGAGAVVAVYTSSKPTRWSDCQSQSIAYSLDNGRTFTKYDGNPVLVSEKNDFRDPKVFWYAPGKHWVMILAAGQEMEIYSSPNLKKWKKESSFGLQQGAHGGVWECPDLIKLPIEGTDKEKWVLICNLNPGGPFGGSAAQYFTGSFNGKKFVNESPTVTKWLDWGKDNYATVTWSNAPEGKTVAIGWMSNWQYQTDLPTAGYRGTNTIARELTLYEQDGETYVKSVPVAQMEQARELLADEKPFKVSGKELVRELPVPSSGAFEIEMEIKNDGAEKIGFNLCNENGDKVVMYFDAPRSQFVMDRSESGKVDFNYDFPATTIAPAAGGNKMSVRIFVDKTSIEVFGDGGRFAMTNLVFPTSTYDRLSFFSERGSFTVSSLKLHKIQ